MEYEDYVNTGYSPERDDLVCSFYLEHVPSVDFDWAAGAVAAESSVGTWDPGLTTMTERIAEMRARVFELDEADGRIRVAYPPELFESGNLPQILSSIAGNIYGLKEVERLRLLDVEFSAAVARGFDGPQLGLDEVRSRAGAEDRPLAGTIVKPKLGLRADEHADVAYESWAGGLDVVKDDENLTDMGFNGFYDRVEATLDAKREAEDETGETKLYFPNVTAPLGEMKERADHVAENGGDYVMVDVLTAGWSAVQEIRDHLAGTGVGIHAHRAQHAAYTRLRRHGISMLSIAKFARLVGVDNLHAGSVVGKMEGEKEDVVRIYDFLRSDWHTDTVIPVASGGLHPGLVPEVVGILGSDIVVQAGGGVHGHPDGSRSGARAMRAAVDAVSEGVSLDEKADESRALGRALEKWGTERR